MVEIRDALARELEVLFLVLAHGHVRGAMDEDVGGLEHRIGKEAQLELLGDVGVEAFGVFREVHFALINKGSSGQC